MRNLILFLLLNHTPFVSAQTAPVAVVQTATIVNSVALSPDGKWVATLDEPGRTPAVWEVETGRKILALGRAKFPLKGTNSAGQVYESYTVGPTEGSVLAFAPDGRCLAAFPAQPDPSSPPVVWNLDTGDAIGPWNRDSAGHLTLAGTDWTADEVRAWRFGQPPALPSVFAKASAISADGSLAAVVTGAKETMAVEVWDVKNNRKIASVPAAGKVNTSRVTFSPDGGMLAIVVGNGAEVWKLNPLTRLTTVAPNVWFPGILFSPDGRYLLLYGTSALEVVGGPTWTSVLKYVVPEGESQTGFTSVEFGRDGRHVAATDGHVHVWDLKTGQHRSSFGRPDQNAVLALAASADGRTLAVARGEANRGINAERGSEIELWPLAGATLPRTLASELYSIRSLAFSHDSQWLGAASQDTGITGRYTSTLVGQVRLWHVAEGAETKLVIKGKNSMIDGDWSATNVAFSPDDKQLVADVFTVGDLPDRKCDPDAPCGDYESLPYDVRSTFFDIASGRAVNSTALGGADSEDPSGITRSFWLSPDGRRAFVRQEKFTYIDTLTGRRVRAFQLPQLAPAARLAYECDRGLRAAGFVAFSPDMRQVAISNGDEMAVVDAKTGAANVKDSALIADNGGYTALAGGFSPEGGTLVVSTCSGSLSDGELRVYAASNLQMRAKTHMSTAVTSFAFTPGGALFFAGGYDGLVRLWDAHNGLLVASLVRSRDGEWIAFTPDGLFDASPNGAGLLAWRVHGRLVSTSDLLQMRLPGLLAKLVSGSHPAPPTPLTTALDRIRK